MATISDDFRRFMDYRRALAVTESDPPDFRVAALDTLSGGQGRAILQSETFRGKSFDEVRGAILDAANGDSEALFGEAFNDIRRRTDGDLNPKSEEDFNALLAEAEKREKKPGALGMAWNAAKTVFREPDYEGYADFPWKDGEDADRERFANFAKAWRTFNGPQGRAASMSDAMSGTTPEWRESQQTVMRERDWADSVMEKMSKRRKVRDYIRAEYDRNLPVMLGAVKAGLSSEAGSIIDSAVDNGLKWDDSRWPDFRRLPQAEQAKVAAAIIGMRPTEAGGAFRAAVRKMGIMAKSVWWDSPRDEVASCAAWFTDADYQREKESQSWRRELLQPKFRDFGFLGNSLAEAGATLGYGTAFLGPAALKGAGWLIRGAGFAATGGKVMAAGAAAAKYGGTALYAIDTRQQYLNRIALDGGDVNKPGVQLVATGVATASAMVESIKWETFAGLRGLARAQADAYSKITHSIFGKLAERYGITDIAGMGFAEALGVAVMERTEATFYEALEECIQQTMEEITVMVGTGKEVKLSDAMEAGAEAFAQSLGPMFLTMLAGLPGAAFGSAMNPSFDEKAQAEIVRGAEQVRDIMKGGAPEGDTAAGGAMRAINRAFSAWSHADSKDGGVAALMRMGFGRKDATRLDGVFTAISSEANRIKEQTGRDALPESMRPESAADILARASGAIRRGKTTPNTDGSETVESDIEIGGRKVRLVERIRRGHDPIAGIDIRTAGDGARGVVQSLLTSNDRAIQAAMAKNGLLGKTADEILADAEMREKAEAVKKIAVSQGDAQLNAEEGAADASRVVVDIRLSPDARRDKVRHEHVHAIEEVLKAVWNADVAEGRMAPEKRDALAGKLAESAVGSAELSARQNRAFRGASMKPTAENEKWNEEWAPVLAELMPDERGEPSSLLEAAARWAWRAAKGLVGLDRRRRASRTAVDYLVSLMRTGVAEDLESLTFDFDEATEAENEILDEIADAAQTKAEAGNGKNETGTDEAPEDAQPGGRGEETGTGGEAQEAEGAKAPAAQGATEGAEPVGAGGAAAQGEESGETTDPGLIAAKMKTGQTLTLKEMALLAEASGGRITTEFVLGRGYRYDPFDKAWKRDPNLKGAATLPGVPYMGIDGKVHEPASYRKGNYVAGLLSAPELAEREDAEGEARHSLAARADIDGTIADSLPPHLRGAGREVIAERADDPAGWAMEPDGTPVELSQRDWLRREASRRYATEAAAPTAGERDALALHDAIEATREIPTFRPTSGLLAELVSGYRRGDPQIERRIIDWAVGIIPDPVTNPAIGEINTSRGSIRSILHHVRDARSRGPLKVLVLEHLGEILPNAVLVDEGDDNGEHFYNLAHRLSFDGTPYIARVAVKRDRNGNITYDVEFSRKDRLSNAPATGTGASANASAKPAHSTTEILLQRAYSVKRFSISGIYTGGAADYDKPSLHYVGSGEGAQVYGWGLYGSNVRGVAEGYAAADRDRKRGRRTTLKSDVLFDGKPVRDDDSIREKYLKVIGELEDYGSVDKVLKNYEFFENHGGLTDNEKENYEWLKANRDRISMREVGEVPQHLYEQTFFTNRAPGDESHLLKWYEPVTKEQKQWVREAYKKEVASGNVIRGVEDVLASRAKLTGQTFYEYIAEHNGKDGPRITSEFLARAGIDGVKYPVDSYGTTVKDGDEVGWNYVSFRDDNIRVDHKWVDGQQRYSLQAAAPTAEELAEAQRQYDEVVARYTNPDGTRKPGWMKAPNGRPTSLTERQWVQVRTENFKRWFGDWEALAELVLSSGGMDKDAAIERLNALIGAELTNNATGIVAYIHTTQRNKIVSNAATRKSADNGFDHRAHNAAAGIIDKLWKHAVLFEDRADRADDPNIKSIKRFIAPFNYGGRIAFAYITAKETEKSGHRIYSLELEEVKAVEGMLETLEKQSPASTSLTKDSLRQLAEKVKPDAVSKVVDENGEPLVVWHGSQWDPLAEEPGKAAFDPGRIAERADGIRGFFFRDAPDAAEYYGRNRAFFLNVRNPLVDVRGDSATGRITGADAAGHDGIIAKADDSIAGNPFLNRNLTDRRIIEIVAFSPSQIKSATDNAGTFSERPDIRYSIGAYLDNALNEMDNTPDVWSILDEFEMDKMNGREKKFWRQIPAKQYQAALRKFMREGELFDYPESTLRDWLDIIIRNTLELDTITKLAGHDSFFPGETVADFYEDQYEGDTEFNSVADFLAGRGFYEWASLPDGSGAWSDNGIAGIFDALRELPEEPTAGEMITAINRAMDAYHVRGDLASMIVEGGKKTLAEISSDATPGARWSIVSALAAQQDSTTTYTDSHGVKRTLLVVAGGRRYGWRKIAYKHCVDFGTARTGGFTLDELRRYEQSILNGGAKSYDKKAGRRTFKWKSPDGVTFTIGTYVEGSGKKAREVVNTVYTDRDQKTTQKMLGTHFGKQASFGQPSNNILPQAAGNVKRFSLSAGYSLWNNALSRATADDRLVGIAAALILTGKESGLKKKISQLVGPMGGKAGADEVIAEARKLVEGEASGRARALLDKGDARGAVGLLSDAAMGARPERALAEAMGAGAKIAEKGSRLQRDALLAILRSERGIDLGELVGATGLDFTAIMHRRLVEKEKKEEESKKGGAESPEADADAALDEIAGAEEEYPDEDFETFEGPPTPENRERYDAAMERLRKLREKARRLRDRAVAAVQAQRLKEALREKAGIPEPEAPADGEGGGGGAEKKARRDPLAEPTAQELIDAFLEEEDIDFADPRTLAAFLKIYVSDGIREAQGEKRHLGEGMTPKREARFWKNPTVVRQYAVSMRNVIQDMAGRLLDHGSYTYAEAMRLAQEMGNWESAKAIERTTATLIGRISAASIRQTSAKIAEECRRQLKDFAGGGKFSELDPDFTRKVAGIVERDARWLRHILTLSKEQARRVIDGWDGINQKGEVKHHEGIDEKIKLREAAYADAGAEKDAEGDNEIIKLARQKELTEKYGGMRDLLPGEARELQRELTEWMQGRAADFATRMARLENEAAEDKALIAEAARARNRDGSDRIFSDRNPGAMEKLGNAAHEHSLSTVEQRLRDFFRYATGETAEKAEAFILRFCHRLAEATQKYETYRQDCENDLSAAAIESLGGAKAARRWMLHLSDAIPADIAAQLSRTGRRTMTFDQALHLYAYLCQTASYGDNISRHGREGQKALLESVLTADDLKMLAALRKIYADRRAPLSAAREAVTGVGFGTPDPWYFPVKIDVGETRGISEGGGARALTLIPAAFSDRVRHTLDVDETAGAMEMFMSRMDEGARAVAYGELGIHALNVFGSRTVKTALSRFHGEGLARDFQEHLLDTLSGEQAKRRADGDLLNRFANGAMAFGTYSALWGNVLTAMKQSVSQYAHALRRRPGDVGVTCDLFAIFRPGWREAFDELRRSDGWRVRYGDGGIMPELRSVLHGAGRGETLFKRILRAGMTPIQFGDALGGIPVAVGQYMRERDAYIEAHPGCAYAEACQYAQVEAFRAVEATQQSSLTENKPRYARRGGPGMRMLMMFASAPNLQSSWESVALREWRAKADPYGDMGLAGALRESSGNAEARRWLGNYLKSVVVNHVTVPLAMEAVSRLFAALLGDEPPDAEEEAWNIAILILLGQYGRLAYVGSLLDYGLRKAAGVEAHTTGPSFTRTLERLAGYGVDLAGSLLEGDLSEALEDADKAAKAAVAPYRHIRKAAKNWGD